MFHVDIDFSFSIEKLLNLIGLITPIIVPIISLIIAKTKEKDVLGPNKANEHLSVPDIPSFIKKKK